MAIWNNCVTYIVLCQFCSFMVQAGFPLPGPSGDVGTAFPPGLPSHIPHGFPSLPTPYPVGARLSPNMEPNISFFMDPKYFEDLNNQKYCKPRLSEKFIYEILLHYYPFCNVSILSNGFVQLNQNDTLSTHSSVLHNMTLKYPSLLIQCSNNTETTNYAAFNNNFTKFLSEKALNYSSSMANIKDDSKELIFKDKFIDSVLLITFGQTAICVFSWMLCLILALLPASNYNNKIILVKFYVLFYSIVQTVYLTKANNEIFRYQYEMNIQDANIYEHLIVDSTGYKITELLINIISNVNWLYIILFMYHTDINHSNGVTNENDINQDEENKLGFALKKNKSTLILLIALVLISVDNACFAILFWKKDFLSVRIIYKTLELIMYAIFLCFITVFLRRNFGFILAPRRMHDVSHHTFRDKLQAIWADYYEVIPLMIFNAIIFVSSYFMIIYFTARGFHTSRWKYNTVYFLKLLITVNFWGLIGVLKKREAVLNKTTVLGRKINNKDKYFVNPKVNYDGNTRGNNDLENNISPNSNDENNKFPKRKFFFCKSKLPKPTETWKTNIGRMRERRKLANLKTSHKLKRRYRRQGNNNIQPQPGSSNNSNGAFRNKGATEWDSIRTSSDNIINRERKGKNNPILDSDTDSVDTELASNYIFHSSNDI